MPENNAGSTSSSTQTTNTGFTASTAQTITSQSQQSTTKTYTQEQVNAMMANEKRTARQATLKELGFEVNDDQSYADTVKGIKKTLDAGKTQQQLDAEARTKAESALTEANKKAATLEMKIAALAAGVKPDCVDDIITLAQAKVNDNTTIEKALEDLKSKYPTLFGGETTNTSSGTGNPANPPKKGTVASDGMGKRLAQKTKPQKSAYFNN